MGLLLVLILTLGPLLIAPGYSFYFDITPKLLCFLAGTSAALALWLIRGGHARPAIQSKAGKWLVAILIAQAVSLAVSTLASQDPDLSWGGSNWRRFGFPVQACALAFAFLIAVYASGGAARLRLLLRGIAIAGLPAALYGIAQYFGWDPWLPSQAYHIGEGFWTIVRPPGTLGYASYFATYCLSVVFVAIAVARSEKARSWRALGIVSSVACASAIMLSGTRAGIFALVAGVALLAALMRPKLSIRMLGTAALVALAGIAFYFSPAGHNLRTRARWYVEDPLGGARLMLWRDSARMGAARWVAGYGPETFSATFPRFESIELARAYPNFHHESPHNIFLDALAAQGVLGAALLLALIATGAYAARTAYALAPEIVAPLAAGLAAAVLSQQFTSFTLVPALYLYAVVALLVSIANSGHAPPGPARPIRLATVLKVMIFGPAIVVFLVFAVRLAVSDRALALADRSLSAGDLSGAAKHYAQARTWMQRGAQADIWYSRKLASSLSKNPDPAVRLWAFQEAFTAAARAPQTSDDRQNAWYNLAVFHAARNDLSGTKASLRAAIEAAPDWFKPHWMLARILRLEGRWREAAEEADRAVYLNGGKDREVAETSEEIHAAIRKQLENSR